MKLRNFVPFLAVAALSLPACTGKIASEDFAIPAQRIPGGGILGSLLNLTGYQFPFTSSMISSQEDPALLSRISISRIAMRTAASPSDRADEAMLDEDRMGGCVEGQPSITFLRTIEIRVKRRGASGAGDVLASYSLPSSQQNARICSVELEVNEDINLKDYLPDYELSVSGSGVQPDEDAYVGGITTVDFYY